MLAAVAPATFGLQQKPIDPKLQVNPVGPLDATRRGLLNVDAPAALSRTELARRLKTLDGSLPNALAAGTAVVLTPGRLQYGRTHFGIYGAELVALNSRGAPVAVYSEVREAGTEGVYIEFDAAGASIYAVNLALAGNQGPSPGGAFDVAVWGPNHSATARVAPSADGHLVYPFAVPRAGRYTVSFERQPGDGGRWHFYRAELHRVR